MSKGYKEGGSLGAEMEREGVMGRKTGVGKDTEGRQGGTEPCDCGVGSMWPIQAT